MPRSAAPPLAIAERSWIAGLMRENYEAVGFLPFSTLERQYIANERYILQTEEHGRNVGYLLHGALHPGGILTVAQHCIQYDSRLRGYGEVAFQTLIDRAKHANCRAIKVRCAAELPSNEFWCAMGLQVVNVKHPINRRNRAINVMMLDLWPTLWGATR